MNCVSKALNIVVGVVKFPSEIYKIRKRKLLLFLNRYSADPSKIGHGFVKKLYLEVYPILGNLTLVIPVSRMNLGLWEA